MDVQALVSLLESVRDKLALAVHDVRRGDIHSAREQLEQAGTEMQDAGAELRS
jgi:cellobiose-specific phosphotransferase system component IIA